MNEGKVEFAAESRSISSGTAYRFLIHLEIANSHRLTRAAALAQTLRVGGHEVYISYEPRISFRYSPTELEIFEWDARKSIGVIENMHPDLEFIPVDTYAGNCVEALELAQKMRREAIAGLVRERGPSHFMMWGGDFEYQRGTREGVGQAEIPPEMIFFEVAWFPQQDFLYFDRMGVNRASSLVNHEFPALNQSQKNLLKRMKEQFRAKRIGLRGPAPASSHIFVPLQIETDTSYRLGAPFDNNAEFVRFLEEWVPKDYSAVLKLHPKERIRTYPVSTRRKDFTIVSSGSLDQMMREASHVVGLNSTVLLEAAMLGKKTIAFGEGLFSGSNALIEANRNHDPMATLRRQVDNDAVDRFLYDLLFRRQVSLQALTKRDYSHLASREPFEALFKESGNRSDNRKWLGKILKGEAVIKIGNSRIAKTAILDVEKGGEIVIGDDSEIRHGAVLEVSGRYNGSIKIGSHSVIGNGSWLQGSGTIQIGDDVIIGPYASIVSTNHQYEDVSVPIARQPLTIGEIVIENDVWLGAHVTVATNVKIGAHSIIGANSFVNRDIPPYSIAVGSPARVIRNRKSG